MILSLLLTVSLALAITPEEEALRELADSGKLVSARSRAEALLEDHPDSVWGHYVLARALWQSEGELSRAHRHYAEAVELFEAEEWPEGDETWRAHARSLNDLAWLCGQLAEHEEKLDWIERHDRQYSPKMYAERGWPLMMLQRTDEAREVALEAIAAEDSWQQSVGWNTLCALESNTGDRKATWEACLGALENERGMPAPDVTVDANNAAIAAYGVLDFEQVEALARESATGSTDQVSNPHQVRVGWLLLQGRGEEAVAAMWDMKRWTQDQTPPMRVQARAEAEAALARLLLVAGQPDKGLELIQRALRFPSRGGMSSTTHARTLGGHTWLKVQLRALALQRARERAAAGPWWRRAWRTLLDWLPDPVGLRDQAVVRSAVAEEEILVATLRPYVDGGIDMAVPWSLGGLVEVLGPGVMSAALQQARALEVMPEIAPYYDAFDAERLLAEGEPAAAAQAAEAALQGLPQLEVLLRARVRALWAEAAWQQGEQALALLRFEEALQDDPGVIRRLGLALPAQVEAPPTPLGEAVAQALMRSPRLTPYKGGFSVSVEGKASPRVCLRSPKGALLSCTEPVPAPELGGLPAHVLALSEAFHERVFSLPLGLSNVDLNSLDGQTIVAHEARREAVERLLEGL
ncbi:MAG: hypothetical protein H6740_19950 [Alphaproteobacteria bacterium]|nr:hypothetical protein [Alphaproteobacteria bacterium]